jgi:uncharacterized protein YfaS (alpha-2-macroglobulin family)
MYDRSLDMFVPHNHPNLANLLPSRFGLTSLRSNITVRDFSYIYNNYDYSYLPYFNQDSLIIIDGYGVGGVGNRTMRGVMYDADMDGSPHIMKKNKVMAPESMMLKSEESSVPPPSPEPQPTTTSTDQAPKEESKEEAEPIRENFQETAFFKPHLITDTNGDVQIEFEVPDSLTSWNVYIHAMTKDLKFMTQKKETITSKDLMVRPYVPRFFREGDEANLKVVMNNATDQTLDGEVSLVILDPETQEDKSQDFGLTVKTQNWQALGKQSANVSWKVKAPNKLGIYAFKVIAKTKDLSDGELRPLPVLPSRMHLVQSKFVTLKQDQTRTLYIPDLEKSSQDQTLIHQSLILNVDAQLVYTAIKALPYLVDYPYECVEQTLNRFLCTGIVSSLYKKYPEVAQMAKEFSKRETQLEPWKKEDPNRKMSLEETPWLNVAEGGSKEMDKLINVLDPKIALAQKEMALDKLQKAQNNDGSFPWWSGGPGNPYMTLYLMHGFGKAQEFDVEVPQEMIRKSWVYLASYFRNYYAQKMIKEDFGYEFITFLNYVLSCYKDPKYYIGTFTIKERQEMLEYSFKHWKKHSPYLKAYLSLTLMRMDKPAEAKLVMESIMDSAKTKEDQGTFWAREDRSWLWYNDNIESHAFILRALQEVMPDNQEKLDGLILWILLNKKMNQWKSTKATSEVIYSLVYTMHRQKTFGQKEGVKIQLGKNEYTMEFLPNKYTGDKNQIVIAPNDIIPTTMAKAQVTKTGPGFAFASMTWHYSTEKMPDESRGDYLSVNRSYFLRKHEGDKFVLYPLVEGTEIAIGDQIEVHLSIASKHPMEYVHLRDPRGSGFEPENQVSGHHWDLGLYWYEEIRDSGANFFFEWLPQGEYTFKYRVRANMSGKFKVGPAVIQSMYAPEFSAFSSGTILEVK